MVISPKQDMLRSTLTAAYHRDEEECVRQLAEAAAVLPAVWQRIEKQARILISQVRNQRVGKGGIDAFLYQYELSTQEGIALMCLAEALLRIPDTATIDRLIRDKLTSAEWNAHHGKSESFFVNAVTWGLMLTGAILERSENSSDSLGAGLAVRPICTCVVCTSPSRFVLVFPANVGAVK